MSVEHSVLDLFPGKKDGIFTRMADSIKTGLEKKVKEIKRKLKHKTSNEKIVEAIAKKLYVNADALKRIYNEQSGEGDVSYELFDRLEHPLDLSINQVLKKPVKHNVNKEYWFGEFGQCITHPIFPAGGQGNLRPKDGGEDLYLTLRAITELRGANRR
jgi:hypothetical protein